MCSCFGVLLTTIKSILNSNFTTSLIGAFAGAYGGQWIVGKSKNREELLSQISNTNAATTMCFSIWNSFINLKKQSVQDLHENFHASRTEFLSKIEAGETPTIQADLRYINPTITPVEILHKQVFEKISISGRPLLLVIQLIQSINSLTDSLLKRNQWIEQAQKQGIRIESYFAIRDSNGHTDEIYKSALQGIRDYTDDCIFFSSQLCKDLAAHAKQLQTQFKKKYDQKPNITTPDFSDASLASLMPDERKYSSWFENFKSES